jgi:hypothetical protein
MVQLDLFTAWMMHRYLAVVRPGRAADDRGDVPGWVMVTVMTAALVVTILAAFKSKITDAISNALDSVTGAK